MDTMQRCFLFTSNQSRHRTSRYQKIMKLKCKSFGKSTRIKKKHEYKDNAGELSKRLERKDKAEQEGKWVLFINIEDHKVCISNNMSH